MLLFSKCNDEQRTTTLQLMLQHILPDHPTSLIKSWPPHTKHKPKCETLWVMIKMALQASPSNKHHCTVLGFSLLNQPTNHLQHWPHTSNAYSNNEHHGLCLRWPCKHCQANNITAHSTIIKHNNSQGNA